MWQAPLFNFSGYGDEARAMVLAVQRRGYPVTARSWGDERAEFLQQYAETAPEHLLALHRAMEQPLSSPFFAIIQAPGYSAERIQGARASVARTMFETDGLPPDWVKKLNDMDEVWVPSSFNAVTFKEAGVTAPVHVVPGGVDATTFRPGLRPLRVTGARGTVFLSVFEWAYRKGWDVILSAWAAAFGPTDDVSLVLRTSPPGETASVVSVESSIQSHLESIGRSRADVAPIIVLDRPLSFEELPRLYAAADVYVSASRGEGCGRPMMEAMACRLPTVATRWSGNLDFMDDDNSVLVDVDALVTIDQRSEFAFYRGQHWAEPSVEHLTDVLRRLAAEPELRRKLGTRARADIERRWQWKHTSQAVVDRVEALTETHMARSRGPGVSLPDRALPRVRWEGDFYAHHSLALVNRTLTDRLARSGVVTVTPLSRESPPFPPDTAQAVERLARSTPPTGGAAGPDVVVRHRWPPDLSPSPDAQPLVVIQPWEFGGIPTAWISQLRRNVTEVWCPSTWVADCYVRSGMPEDSVVVVPNGVDTDRFAPDGPRYPLRTTKSRRLLFVGGTIPRKGIDVLVDAYLDAFTQHDDVCLVVKAFGSSHVYRGSTIDEQLRAIAADPSSPSIELIDDELTDEEVPALYRSCDVLVHPYRGEGFGLPIAEAMASGLPVVVTGYGACLDFCDEDNALFVPATLRSLDFNEVGPSPIGYWWAEPDKKALAALLRRVVDDPALTDGMGAAGRARILADYTWGSVAALAGRRLVALAGRGGGL